MIRFKIPEKGAGETPRALPPPRSTIAALIGRARATENRRGRKVASARQRASHLWKARRRAAYCDVAGSGNTRRRASRWAKSPGQGSARLRDERQSARQLGLPNGRSGGTRTPSPRFWRPVLYQLSYTPACPRRTGSPCRNAGRDARAALWASAQSRLIPPRPPPPRRRPRESSRRRRRRWRGSPARFSPPPPGAA